MSGMVLVFAMMGIAATQDVPEASFQKAKPVWLENREKERNLFVGFRAVVDAPEEGTSAVLRITASTVYRAFVNGRVAGYGPARGPHGWYRLDELDISSLLIPGRNVVAIEVAGYNANSYYVLGQPSFLQAEIASDGRILVATGAPEGGFAASVLPERVQKVQRYSFQRPFMEAYRMGPGYDRWRIDPDAPFPDAACAITEPKRLLPRGVPYPLLQSRAAAGLVSRGGIEELETLQSYWRDRSLKDIGPKLIGYPEKELELVVSYEVERIKNISNIPQNTPYDPEVPLHIPQNGCQVLDLGVNLSGFIQLRVSCASPVRLYVTFDEMLQDGDVNFKRLGCVNAIAYRLEAGEYALESFEPYTLRYLKIMALDGECVVSRIGLRLFENPDTTRAEFVADDARLNTLFAAGVRTFAQNAVDIFMDCPHRERAGWLCDSFFTARSAMVLSGDTTVERNFLENYLLPERFEHLPEGMLPMCYPADHYDGVFIPNWALWFVLQLGEYIERSGDRALADALRPKVLALFDYFKKFRNENGLLEKLESWVFVEWSAANRFVQDVNYPSNMLYAAALSTAAHMYGLEALAVEAEQIRETIRRQSFDGEFFVDNAERKDGRLKVTRNRTEVCQYFAFYFGVAKPESHPELWRRLCEEFGPKRKDTKAYPEIHEANAFVGNMIRLELLSRAGRSRQILDESIDYLLYMAERTGTLWENVGDYASLNHGFASHIVVTLYRDVLGVRHIDPVNKEVLVRFADVPLQFCRGRIPVGDSEISLEWRKEDGTLRYALTVPEGFTVRIEKPESYTIAPLAP